MADYPHLVQVTVTSETFKLLEKAKKDAGDKSTSYVLRPIIEDGLEKVVK